MTKKELDFVVFCIENVAERLSMNGADVYRLLVEDSRLLDEYIVASYDALHTQGKDYIVDDITEYMREVGLIA